MLFRKYGFRRSNKLQFEYYVSRYLRALEKADKDLGRFLFFVLLLIVLNLSEVSTDQISLGGLVISVADKSIITGIIALIVLHFLVRIFEYMNQANAYGDAFSDNTFMRFLLKRAKKIAKPSTPQEHKKIARRLYWGRMSVVVIHGHILSALVVIALVVCLFNLGTMFGSLVAKF
jgi:hypothetical protein